MKKQIVNNLSRKIAGKIRNKLLIRNVTKTDYKKRALLIYITKPFIMPEKSCTHSNWYEALNIVKALNELEYNVDVVFFECTRSIRYKRYDLVIGMGECYEKSVGKCKKGSKRVFYATGACFITANQLELERWVELYQSGHGYVGVDRFEKPKNPIKVIASMYYSDAIICCGDNKWLRDTYKWTGTKVYSVGAISLTKLKYDMFERNIEACRNNILFIIGKGEIHKGLDKIVNFFSKREQYNLHIIGNLDEGFKNSFKDELTKRNIHAHGFIDVNSNYFIDICNKCSCVVNLSCSEGCCTAVITGMAAGLIPIVTVSEGINIGQSGFLLKSGNEKELDKTLYNISNMNEGEMLKKMRLSSEIANTVYSQQAYYSRVKNALKGIL